MTAVTPSPPGPASGEEPVLEVRGLRTWFHTRSGVGRAVDGLSFHLGRGETLGLVGESGCGKSLAALSVLRLVSSPGRIEGGRVRLRGRDLLDLEEEEMRRVRGNEIAMIFQEPMTSLNPVLTCGDQIAEAVRRHRDAGRQQARERAIDMMRRVGIPAPEQRVDEYPHQLSGGMRQRVMIAMALSCAPDVLIADEPTTALDVTTQAQILDLLQRLQAEFHMAVLLITHDLGVVAETADRVAVMYAGRIVETAETARLFADPRHPYTKGAAALGPAARGSPEPPGGHPRPRPRGHRFPLGLPLPPPVPPGGGPLPRRVPAPGGGRPGPRRRLLEVGCIRLRR